MNTVGGGREARATRRGTRPRGRAGARILSRAGTRIFSRTRCARGVRPSGPNRRPLLAGSGTQRSGFSLAEMMIALAILAMGLLVIGAALPVGVRYTQATVNQATGEAAGEFALDLLRQSATIPRQTLDVAARTVGKGTGVFVPRYFNAANPDDPDNGLVNLAYEPLIKVRPLFVSNVLANGKRGDEYRRADAELSVENWLNLWIRPPTDVQLREYDSTTLKAALSSAGCVYPPVLSDVRLSQTDFLTQGRPNYRMYEPARRPSPSEGTKVLNQRFAWTAFYRRVAYGPGSDPMLYEWIAVVSRLPSAGHRFPVQLSNKPPPSEPVGNNNPTNVLSAWSGVDTATPVPWMVHFKQLPAPPGNTTFRSTGVPEFAQGPPATLQFTCYPGDSGLFPVGSVFLPARNDVQPDLKPVPFVGLAPPAPSTLPVYEVVQRPDDTTVVVKYNGFYPVKRSPNGQFDPISGTETSLWPVWVIPPAYDELEGSPKAPVSPQQSSIVAVARRYVHMRELP